LQQHFFHNILLIKKAHADGLSVENLLPTTVGIRELSIYVKVNPPILTTVASHSPYMQFRLFDVNNNQTIQDVTYVIAVTRGTASSGARQPLLLDFFHTQNGLLTLHVEPNPGLMTIYGEQDPFLNAWVADPGGNILIRGPLLLQGGLYHFHIVVINRNLFIPQRAPKFDAYLSDSISLPPCFIYISSNLATFSIIKLPLLSYNFIKLARIAKWPIESKKRTL
jgi:hypothetical protein